MHSPLESHVLAYAYPDNDKSGAGPPSSDLVRDINMKPSYLQCVLTVDRPMPNNRWVYAFQLCALTSSRPTNSPVPTKDMTKPQYICQNTIAGAGSKVCTSSIKRLDLDRTVLRDALILVASLLLLFSHNLASRLPVLAYCATHDLVTYLGRRTGVA